VLHTVSWVALAGAVVDGLRLSYGECTPWRAR
jgi:hypothetical protein